MMNGGKLIIGAGRHAVETWFLLKDIGIETDVLAFVVDKPEPGMELMGLKVMGTAEVLEQYGGTANKPAVLVAIGALSPNKRLVALFREAGFPFFSAVYPGVPVDRQKMLGEGITITAGCILTCNISIGNYSIINIGSTISHDCVIGNHVNISPGCHLAGNVFIDDDVFVGVGASFIPHVKVGKGSVIAAGACVTKDIPPYTMAAGVPAVVKKQLS